MLPVSDSLTNPCTSKSAVDTPKTSLSIIEVASVCGFVSTPHFSKCYREYFGVPPRDERTGVQARQGRDGGSRYVPTPRAAEASGNEPVSSAVLALAHAKGEPTFASVPLTNG